MDLIELPLPKLYSLFTYKGFAAFTVSSEDPHSFTIQEVPLRYVVNVLSSDSSNKKNLTALDLMLSRFRFYYLKYHSLTIHPEKISLRDIERNEKPLDTLQGMFNMRDQIAMQEVIKEACLFPFEYRKKMIIGNTPLFVFQRENT